MSRSPSSSPLSHPALRPALRAIIAAALAIPLACATAGAPPGAGAPSAGAKLSVSPDRVLAPVNRAVLLGFNFGNWMQVVDFREELQAIDPAQLRFPAGNIGDEHDLTAYALDVFRANLSILGATGTPVVIQTRVFQGSSSIQHDPARNRPEDAADAARWARERGLQVAYWEIGNEPDLFSTTRGDPSWTPERYCDVFRAQARAIKAVDPAARLAGPAVSGAVPGRDRFLERFVALCGDAVDVLTWHIYPTDGTRPDGEALATMAEVDRTIAAHKALWADPARNPRGHARRIAMAVTEYGLSWQTSRMRHIADMVGAMWAMEAALRFDEQGLSAAHYFCLQGTGPHGLLDLGGVKRPTHHAFAALGKLRGDLVAASSTDPELWVHAARDGGRLDVLVTNRATAEKALATGVPGFQLTGGDSFDEAVVRNEEPARALTPAATLRLPPRSITHLWYVAR